MASLGRFFKIHVQYHGHMTPDSLRLMVEFPVPVVVSKVTIDYRYIIIN